MIKNLRYKLIKLKKYKTVIIVIFVSIVLIFEVYACFMLNYLKDSKDEEYQSTLCCKKQVELDNMVEELIKQKLNILSIEKNEESYSFKIKMQGDKNEIYQTLRNLDDYKIVNYEFNVDSNNIEGKVILSYN